MQITMMGAQQRISAGEFRLRMQRAKKPEQPEFRLQRLVADFLDAALPVETSWWCSIPNGARTGAREGAKLKRIGLKAGAPDILIWHGGKTLAIELKSEAGSLSPEQKCAHGRLRKAGVTVAVARSVFDVRAALEGLGVPLREGAAA